MKFHTFGLAAAALLLANSVSFAQDFPNQRVTIAVPFSAGSIQNRRSGARRALRRQTRDEVNCTALGGVRMAIRFGDHPANAVQPVQFGRHHLASAWRPRPRDRPDHQISNSPTGVSQDCSNCDVFQVGLQ